MSCFAKILAVEASFNVVIDLFYGEEYGLFIVVIELKYGLKHLYLLVRNVVDFVIGSSIFGEFLHSIIHILLKNQAQNYCDFVCTKGKFLYLCNVKVCNVGLPPPEALATCC